MSRLSFLQKRKAPPTDGPRVNTKKRRNGQLQSCEPCRKSKLRCDHMMPVCTRCERRNRSTLCVYAAAPMTRTTRQNSSSSVATASVTGSSVVLVDQVLTPRDTPAAGSSQRDTDRQETPVNATRPTGDLPPSASMAFEGVSAPRNILGYMGSTSYSSVFEENQGTLGIERDPEGEDLRHERRSSPAPVLDYQIQQGVDVLKLFKDRALFDRFSKRWFAICQGIVVIEPVIKQLAEGLWATYGMDLRDQDPAKLQALSQKIWNNTQQPLKFDGSFSARQWIGLSTGEGLRWESVALLLTTVGLLSSMLTEWDPIFTNEDGSQISKVKLTRKMSANSDACLMFCRTADSLNDLYLWLLYESCILQTMVTGNASNSVWNRSGETFNTAIALGLHQKLEPDKDIPFFLVELRKRTFVASYSSDKALSTFFGRPPRLIKRYCMLQVPLDLSDHDLVSEGEELRQALASLDSEGWNTSGIINRGTWARTYLYVSMIREDILELALGVDSGDLEKRAGEISRLIGEKYLKLPKHLRVDFDTAFGQRLPPLDSLRLASTRLNYMSTELILERVLIKRAGAGTEKLVQIAKRALSDTLTIVMRRDLMRDLQAEISYFMAAHGLHSAAILAVELLKQEQSPPDRVRVLSRSETVQGLSVFVSCLGSIDQSDGHYEILQQGRRFLKRVLDTVLTPPAREATSSNTATSQTTLDAPEILAAPTFERMDWNVPIGFDADVDFLEWLDNVDLGQGQFGEEAARMF
ncbi:hypothetical protein P152DRAFT_108813 [Eremomyces bilateralis CBS 781.70]|uniref:Zn(2)-C6 fungal-type domain-containing protein n=1 Tax=Eremomyces bilateralis CBS 781.70 TaxID=1392243 RepID=A0A6G1GD68_9PEZI|nr:uncharacterized protein P152DRAFT_108813 [Eremomyces bilateralis CBS 781.70]KAF1816045.1 hypothetical protein P152DRAFT_108813 [Eremomyces bilateralis CBS 781.70]